MTSTLHPCPDNFVDLLTHHAQRLQHKTAYVFLGDGDHVTDSISYDDLATRAQAVAVALGRRHPPGSRVLLLYPSCIDYMVAFFGCLCAGMIAVPVFPPGPNRHSQRLDAVVEDSLACAALTTTAQLQQMHHALSASGPLSSLDVICSDAVPVDLARAWRRPKIEAATTAFLQYTSGSTGTPKGVMVSHRNLVHNQGMLQASFGTHADTVYVSWLPIYHDMGLIAVMLHAFWLGASCHFMAPMSFLQRPVRWLQAISRAQATVSGGPNFAYQLCADRITEDQRQGLDLSSWEVAFNGAEPVRLKTLQSFEKAFKAQGFEHRAWLPCYGMAEVTIIATGGTPDQLPRVIHADKEALGRRRVALTDASRGLPLVGCGRNLPGQRLRIVDPLTGQVCEPGEIGEVWLAGDHVAGGYWRNAGATQDTFAARTSDTGEGPFLRTGDLGALHEGELYLAGRLKDVMIVRGVNHYPHDIEATVETTDAALYPTGSVAFSVDDEAGERVIVAAEVHGDHQGSLDQADLRARIRQQVLERHELLVSDVVLLRPRGLPKTSSGKVQRSRARGLYLAGKLPVYEVPAELQG